MKTSESIKNIAPALLKAQKAIGGAKKGAANPFFKSKYADYGAVLEVSKDPLNDNGILVLQPVVFHDGKSFVETNLIHESGEFISGETEVVCAKQNDPQALGSAITYARRYGLQSLLSIPAEDDDGEGAMARANNNATKFSASEKKAAADAIDAAADAAQEKILNKAVETKVKAGSFRKPGQAPLATTSAAAPSSDVLDI